MRFWVFLGFPALNMPIFVFDTLFNLISDQFLAFSETLLSRSGLGKHYFRSILWVQFSNIISSEYW